MDVGLFDFDLPEDRIALRPAEPREAARLLVVSTEGKAAGFRDHHIRDLPSLLRPDDVLVVNNTRVIAAELHGTRVRDDMTAGVSANLLNRIDDTTWQVLLRPAKKVQPGDSILFSQGQHTCEADVLERADGGVVTLRFALAGEALAERLNAVGQMPLPPYIGTRRAQDEQDKADYQTIFAERSGAVAAPTAGLHFTDALLADIKTRGIQSEVVTLHVGGGTFLPVKAEDTDAHIMHSEWGEVTDVVADRLTQARKDGRRIVCIGTTAMRLIESAASADGRIHPFAAETDIFITPGYRFRAVDALLTNFHLPRSTLFMLVSAFRGLETMKSAYAHAVKTGYRFYSYGDACLLERASD